MPAPISVRARAAAAALLVAAAAGARAAEDPAARAARAALARAGAAGSDVSLAVRAEWSLGRDRAVRFARTVAGRPVLDSDAVVLVDAAGVARFVRADPLPPATGAFRVPEPDAIARAVAALGPSARPIRAPSATSGWIPRAGALRPVIRVDVPARSPDGTWRVLVDADTGAVLSIRDLRQSVKGAVYLVSPAETPDAQCPLTTTTPAVHTSCATAVDVDLAGLTSSTALTGARAQAFDCAGGESPAVDATATCGQISPTGAGDFRFAPAPATGSTSDAFSSVNAYWNVDGMVSWLATLAPTAPAPPPLAVYANAYLGGQPFANAFYDPATESVTLGQSDFADYAYDGPVVAHETAHAWQWASGGFQDVIDAVGLRGDPLALAEGTADALSVSRVARSQLGLYVAAELGQPYVRDVARFATCAGTGRVAYQLGPTKAVDGLIGEPHYDSPVWSGFYWELFTGLAGQKGCGGSCDAAAELQARAVQLVHGAGVTFHEMGDAMAAAADALHPDAPGIGAFVRCVASRRALAACDGRTVPLYAGEHKLALVPLDVEAIPAAFQATVAVTTTQGLVGACAFDPSGGGKSLPGTLYLRRGSPVAVSAGASGALAFASDASLRVAVTCGYGSATATLAGPGTWYGLFVADAVASPTSDYALYQLDVLSGAAPRPAAQVATCTFDPTPPAATGGGGGGGCGCGTGGAGGVTLALLGIALAAPRVARRRAERA